MKREYLSVESAADMIDVSPWTIRKWIKERRISAYKFGGSVRIKVDDLLGFAKVIQSLDDLKAGTELDN